MANKGQWNHSFLHVSDIMFTLLKIANTVYPETVNDKPVKKPIGKSIMPILTGGKERIHENQGMGFELFEMKAYIQDEWKLLRLPAPFVTGAWELYHLRKDPGEIYDVSEKYPEIKAGLLKAWQQYAVQYEVFDHKGRFDVMYREIYSVKK